MHTCVHTCTYTNVWWVESLVNLANRLRLFTKLKSSKLVVTINKPLADLFICQTLFRQTLEKSKFTKHSPCQNFLAIKYIIYNYTKITLCKSHSSFCILSFPL